MGRYEKHRGHLTKEAAGELLALAWLDGGRG